MLLTMQIVPGENLPIIVFYEKKVIHNKNYETGEIGDKMSPVYLCAAKKSAKEAW